jgi:hypothetical protein
LFLAESVRINISETDRRRVADIRKSPEILKIPAALAVLQVPQLKAFLRKIAERSVAGLLNALEACAEIFKPTQCVNYFKACGYDTG